MEVKLNDDELRRSLEEQIHLRKNTLASAEVKYRS